MRIPKLSDTCHYVNITPRKKFGCLLKGWSRTHVKNANPVPPSDLLHLNSRLVLPYLFTYRVGKVGGGKR